MAKSLKIDFSNVRGDFFGGLTAGVVALPLALAFGAQSELGAVSGLYGAIALSILAAIFGGTPSQISGPTAPMTVVSVAIILEAIDYAGGFETAFPIIIATFFLAGIFQILLGVLRVGKYIKYIPYPVVSGFMSGIGVIIFITQIFPFFGAPTPAGGPVGTIKSLVQLPDILNIYAIIVAVSTIALVYITPRFTKVIPGSLASLIIVTLGAYLWLNHGEISLIRDNTVEGMPSGLPKVHLDFFAVFSDIKHLMLIVEFALTLAALGAIDSLLTSIIADNLTKTRHDSNQELIGQGIGNMGAAMIGGIPGAGATMRTVININTGGRQKLSGVIAGLFLLAVLLGLGKFVGNIPNAVLAGILITVGISIIDYKGLRHIRTIPRTDAVVMLTVLFLTVFVGLLEAVGIGMVMASLLFMKNISDVIEHRTQSAPIKEFAPEIPWPDETEVTEKMLTKVYIKHLEGPLFFGFASRFQEMIKAMPKMELVVIRMSRVPYVDQSGLYAMEDAILNFQEQGISVAITGLHGQPEEMFRRINLAPGLVPQALIFTTFAECASWLQEYLKNNHSFKPLATLSSNLDK